MSEKLAQIDYLGVFLSAAGTVLMLVPIAGGGSTFAWNSTLVIAMLIIGCLCAVAFVVVEWRFASLPIMPRKCSICVSWMIR